MNEKDPQDNADSGESLIIAGGNCVRALGREQGTEARQ